MIIHFPLKSVTITMICFQIRKIDEWILFVARIRLVNENTQALLQLPTSSYVAIIITYN